MKYEIDCISFIKDHYGKYDSRTRKTFTYSLPVVDDTPIDYATLESIVKKSRKIPHEEIIVLKAVLM